MTDSPHGATALTYFAGDKAFLRELIVIFREDSAVLMADLRGAVSRGDAEEVRRAAHTLAGSIGYLNTGPAHRAAVRLEELANGGALGGAAELLAELEEAITRLLPTLAAIAAPDGDDFSRAS